MTVLHIRVNMLNKGIRCKFHLKRLSNFPKKCGNRHDLHSAPSPLSGKPGRLILGHFWVPSNRFQSLSSHLILVLTLVGLERSQRMTSAQWKR